MKQAHVVETNQMKPISKRTKREMENQSKDSIDLSSIFEPVVETEEEKVEISSVDKERLGEILARPSIQNVYAGLVRPQFSTKTKTIGVTLGELLKTVEPFTMTVPEYQRDLRIVSDDEAESFHKTTFEYGQLDVVPFILVEIDGILSSLKEAYNSIPLGSDSNREELLQDRISRYTRFVEEDGKKFFILDGQTRMSVYRDWYSEGSDKIIRYGGEQTPTNWTIEGEDGSISKFVINGLAFKDLQPVQQQGIHDSLGVTLVIVTTDSHEIPAATFSIANSGVPVSPTLTDMNSSFNPMKNQVEKLNMREGSEEYSIYEGMGFKEYTERFYKQGSGMFKQHARGEDAFEIMRSIYHWGDRIDNQVAKDLKGVLTFDEGSGKGWVGARKVVADPNVEWDKFTEEWMIATKIGKAQAIKKLAQGKDKRVLKYCMSTKVNAVLFEEILEDVGLGNEDWTNLYVEFFEFDRIEREVTQYLKVTAKDAISDDRYVKSDVGRVDYISDKTGNRLKNTNGYWWWGTVQDSAKLIGYRREVIREFVKENLDAWRKKGYLA